jgi:hypothetical protein
MANYKETRNTKNEGKEHTLTQNESKAQLNPRIIIIILLLFLLL